MLVQNSTFVPSSTTSMMARRSAGGPTKLTRSRSEPSRTPLLPLASRKGSLPGPSEPFLRTTMRLGESEHTHGRRHSYLGFLCGDGGI